MRVMLDTNILIDLFWRREGFYEPARLIAALGYIGEFELWVSIAQVTDLVYVLSHGGKPSYAREAQRSMRALKSFAHICAMDEEDFDFVAGSTWEDLEVAFVHRAALKVKADVILTRNKADFEKSSIPVMDGEEFFAMLEQEHGLVFEEAAL